MFLTNLDNAEVNVGADGSIQIVISIAPEDQKPDEDGEPVVALELDFPAPEDYTTIK